MIKKVKMVLRIKNCDVVIYKGFDSGVIAERTVTFDLPEEEYTQPAFQQSLLEQSNSLIQQSIRIELEEV